MSTSLELTGIGAGFDKTLVVKPAPQRDGAWVNVDGSGVQLTKRETIALIDTLHAIIDEEPLGTHFHGEPRLDQSEEQPSIETLRQGVLVVLAERALEDDYQAARLLLEHT